MLAEAVIMDNILSNLNATRSALPFSGRMPYERPDINEISLVNPEFLHSWNFIFLDPYTEFYPPFALDAFENSEENYTCFFPKIKILSKGAWQHSSPCAAFFLSPTVMVKEPVYDDWGWFTRASDVRLRINLKKHQTWTWKKKNSSSINTPKDTRDVFGPPFQLFPRIWATRHLIGSSSSYI